MDFFKSLLRAIVNGIVPQKEDSPLAPRFSFGAFKNVDDPRNINAVTVQAPVALPLEYKTDISKIPTLNQLAWGTCVWQELRAHSEYKIFKRTGVAPELSARSGYILTKRFDSMPDQQGTMPAVAYKVITDFGIASNAVVPDDNTLSYEQYMGFPMSEEVLEDMATRRFGGYAFVSWTLQNLKQAIYQSGVVGITLDVDANWFSGLVLRVLRIIGRHRTLAYGYDADGIYARNSWGTGWTCSVMKTLGFPAGDFYFKWADYSSNGYDAMILTDIPKAILDHVKALPYFFTRKMNYGETSYDIIKLQERLEEGGFWQKGLAHTGYYGPLTAKYVLAYQKAKKVAPVATLDANGGRYVADLTLNALNKAQGLSFLDAMIFQESRGNDYAVGDLNIALHAYGPLQIRQPVCDDVNAKFGTKLKATDMLGNRALSIDTMNKYFAIYPENDTDEKKARLWNGGPGWRMHPTWTDEYWKELHSYMI